MTTRESLAITLAGLFMAVLIAVILAPLASTAPDGLEKVAQDQEFSNQSDDSPLGAVVLMRDYTFFGMEGAWGKAAAGLAGTVLTFGVAYVLARLLRRREGANALAPRVRNYRGPTWRER